MHEDGFYTTRQPQSGLTWLVSAVRFEQTRSQFLMVVPDKPDPVGLWHSTCFPVKECVGKRLSKQEMIQVRNIVQLFRNVSAPKRYDRAAQIEKLFRQHLEYPPYSLSDNWDGKATQRRAWAEEKLRDKRD